MADWEPRFQPCVSRAVGEDGVSLLECVSGPQEHLDAASTPYISVEYLETVELFDPTTESWSSERQRMIAQDLVRQATGLGLELQFPAGHPRRPPDREFERYWGGIAPWPL